MTPVSLPSPRFSTSELTGVTIGTVQRYPLGRPSAADVGRHPCAAGLLSPRDRSRVELQAVHGPQVDTLRQPREQRRPMADQPGVNHELVLIDQPKLRQCERKRHATDEDPAAGLPLLHATGFTE